MLHHYAQTHQPQQIRSVARVTQLDSTAPTGCLLILIQISEQFFKFNVQLIGLSLVELYVDSLMLH
jgi:hypothetical protein